MRAGGAVGGALKGLRPQRIVVLRDYGWGLKGGVEGGRVLIVQG